MKDLIILRARPYTIYNGGLLTFTKQLSSEILINSSAKRVWELITNLSASMTHMEDVSNILSATIENSVSNPMGITADQEVLRKELLTEMAAEKTGAEIAKVKEQVSKELQKT